MLDKNKLRAILTPEQFSVVCESGTEPPFRNAYWDNHRKGIYVDVVTGEVLFSSADKFDSGTGWPSFTRLVKKETVVEIKDTSLGMVRTEVRSASSDAHLGHVFDDGPMPTRLRYCINSASLKFIPIEEMEKSGYTEYLKLFDNVKTEAITFAAGCFWGVEAYFKRVKGVVRTTVGYTGGHTDNPTYEDVCSHTTGHAESVKVEFDPAVVPLEKLLRHFWRMHDPTTKDRQGNDVGDQYRSAVFFQNPSQEKVIRESLEKQKSLGGYKNPIVTEVVPAGEFWRAEEYHQDYLTKNPGGYCHVDLAGAKADV